MNESTRFSAASNLALVGDLGGTNARFAIADLSGSQPQITASRSLRCSDFPNVDQAIEAYLGDSSGGARPAVVALAAAGPVVNGAVKFTNNPWHCSERSLRALGFKAAKLVNDFEALGYAAGKLIAADLLQLGSIAPAMSHGSIAVLGPGTGFGVAVLARDVTSSVVLATEAGNVGFAPGDPLEDEIVRLLRARLGFITVESLLSGRGLVNLYGALCTIERADVAATAPEQITQQARSGDRIATLTVARFCAILGSVAGDAVLAYGARGGVYVTGGIADTLAAELPASQFRERFEAKGRYREYVSAVSSALITRPHTALLGAAEVARGLL